MPSTQTLTQAERYVASLPKEEGQPKVCDLVQYLLIMDQKKIPIKKLDINKYVLKEHSRAFNMFFRRAKTTLKEVFGINLIELDAKQKSYILVNILENDDDRAHLVWPPEDNAKMGLLMVILTTIFMKGNIMQDSLLYHMLKKLGIDTEQNHPVFGDLKRLITQEFVRMGYLEYVRDPKSDPPVYDFKWGPRAKLEISKRNALDFVCQIYEVDPEIWTSQWQDVKREEELTNGN
ncbi:hypothetical protein NP493_222g02010 [Ridgeia piscesae]|uniref:MAGE domain-containing protein n=1 Tax=Ridgeia piscesae TaxID=27915 RepID=A0AAD9UDX2_RIDPI|nr:hypothetical protein NP493_222g02010 [Ridgeia piscesae]